MVTQWIGGLIGLTLMHLPTAASAGCEIRANITNSRDGTVTVQKISSEVVSLLAPFTKSKTQWNEGAKIQKGETRAIQFETDYSCGSLFNLSVQYKLKKATFTEQKLSTGLNEDHSVKIELK